jgi:VanZ family protein
LGKIALSPFDGSGVMSARWAWDACAEILAALPLGVLGHVKSNRSTRRSPSAAFCLGAAIVLLVELAQIFLSSHSSKSTDVLFGWIGVGAGVSVGARLRRRSPEVGGLSELFSGPALATIAVWSLVLCAYHWLPYDFGVDSEAIKRKLANLSLLPFAGYQSGSDLKALSDLLTKLALSAPFGVAAAFVLRNHVARRPIVVAGWMLVAACVFGAIELGQFFLPTRSPDTTDILTGMVGTFAGLSLGRWLHDELRRERK